MDSALLAPFGAFSIVLVFGAVVIQKLWSALQAERVGRIEDQRATLPALTQASIAMTESTRVISRYLDRG